MNGKAQHNNPNHTQSYVPGELPEYPSTIFNGLSYCFEHNIVRLGWPDTGDLRKENREGALSNAYDLDSLPAHIRSYLETFRGIAVGSIILVPDKDCLGNIYIAEVVRGYEYFHQVPEHPYEHAHRVGVRWDRGADGQPLAYRAVELAINVNGGFWSRAFCEISSNHSAASIISRINALRKAMQPVVARPGRPGRSPRYAATKGVVARG